MRPVTAWRASALDDAQLVRHGSTADVAGRGDRALSYSACRTGHALDDPRAYLLLPVGASIKFEMVPQFDKGSIASIAALVGCSLVAGSTCWLGHGLGLVQLLVLALLIGPFVTSELNGDPVSIGGRISRGSVTTTLCPPLSRSSSTSFHSFSGGSF